MYPGGDLPRGGFCLEVGLHTGESTSGASGGSASTGVCLGGLPRGSAWWGLHPGDQPRVGVCIWGVCLGGSA